MIGANELIWNYILTSDYFRDANVMAEMEKKNRRYSQKIIKT